MNDSNKDIHRIVEAEAFIVRDRNGKKRASLSALQDTPILKLYDTKEQCRLEISLGREEHVDIPGLAFYDSEGRGRMLLSLVNDFPQVTLMDENGNVMDFLPRSGG
ncbi:MAG: hypothetical protein JSU61_13765 [Fidelibacterota bacterium]|nr:MAG: hypothetical protein JSU61_13765 [Candidatus Neomarinimicrobiota bacterium]